MANAFYERGSSFNPDELADGDAIEAEFDAVVRGFDTIGTAVDANKAGYPSQTFHVAPATESTHAPQKSQLDAHDDKRGYDAHGATSINTPGALMVRDSDGDVAARRFIGGLTGNADSASNATEHITKRGYDAHGATSGNSPGNLMTRDENGDVAARTFVGVATSSRMVVDTAPNGGSATLVSGEMAGSDFFRVLITGTDDGGWAEIATADNGNEPIFVRQYTGAFQTIARSLCLLDANGNTTIPGDLYLFGGSVLLEYGSNAAGEYYRFANGVQICTRAISAGAQLPMQHGYTAGFVSNPIIAISNDCGIAAYSSTVNVTAAYFSFISSTTNDTIRIIAIGRWRW